MDLSLIDLKDLELLLALHQEGSLKAASVRLGLTPSALSHRIHDMEGRLDIALVTRQGHLALTSHALRLIPHAERVMEDMANLLRSLRVVESSRVLAVSSLVLEGGVMDGIVQLLASQSEGRWEIRTGRSRQVEDWVECGQADVGIIRFEGMRPGFHYELFADDRLVAVANPTFLSQGPWARSIYVQWPWILFSAHMGHGQAVTKALRQAASCCQGVP